MKKACKINRRKINISRNMATLCSGPSHRILPTILFSGMNCSPETHTIPATDSANRSLPRKYWHGFLVCFVTALTAATSNDAGSAQDGMNSDLGISWGAMNTAVGVLFIGIGYWTLLISPAAWLYGRRITYLVCIAMGLGGAVWFAR